MDIAHLVDEVAFRLALALPHISLDTAAHKPTASKHVDPITLREATAFWTRLIPVAAAYPDLLQAAEKLANQPSRDALAEFETVLAYLLTIDNQLRADLHEMLRFHGLPASKAHASLTRSDGQQAWSYFSRVIAATIAGAAMTFILREIAESVGRGTPEVIAVVVVGIFIAIFISTKLAAFRGMPRPVFVGIAAIFPGAYLISALGLFFFLRADPDLDRSAANISKHGRWMMLIQTLPILLLLVVGPINWEYYTYFFNNEIGFIAFLVMIFAWLLSGAALFIGYWQGRATDGLMFGTVSAVTGFMMLITGWCILLGQAAGRLSVEF